MKRLFFFIYFSFIVLSLWAVKAYPGMLTHTQPDGSLVNYYICGDENFNYMISEDGSLLTFDDYGALTYAKIVGEYFMPSLDKVKVSSVQNDLDRIGITRKNRLYSSIQRASSNKGYPLKGSPKSLVILVNFADVEFSSQTPQQDFFELLNKVGYDENGATGSARDYFRRASNGVFEPEFVVVGPYTLPNDRKFYGEQEKSIVDKRPGNMIVDACRLANEDIDFTEFDENNDGYVDNVFVYYAGHNQAEGGGTNTVWPHRSYIETIIKLDDVQLGDYACTSELRGSNGTNMCGIGTFVHEFGHVLSLPDFYDTEYSGHETLGSWDVMDNGSYNDAGRTPPTYSAYERFYLGWMTPKQLTSDTKIDLEPISISNTAYLLATSEHNMDGANPDPKEFFLLENRAGVNHDGVPAEGLLITRVFYNRRNWDLNVVNNFAKNLGVEICCASGSTKSPRANVFPGSKRITDYTFVMRDGTVLSKSLSQITKSDATISFVYGDLESVPNFEVSGDDLHTFYAVMGEEQIKTVNIKGRSIAGQVHLSLQGENYSMRELGSEDSFLDKLSFDVVDSLFDVNIEIKYKPSHYTYSNYISESLLLSSDSYEKAIVLRGSAPRPTFVVPPFACAAENVTPYTFTAVWDSVFDATEYLLSVYSISGIDTNYVLLDQRVPAIDAQQLKYDVNNLQGETIYKYRVKASDKDLFGRYENITDYSNEVSVTTLYGFGLTDQKLDISKKGDRYVVYLPIVDDDYSLFIYSLDGQLITSIPVYFNIVELPTLRSNNIYILKYASNTGLKRKTKVVKLYYE